MSVWDICFPSAVFQLCSEFLFFEDDEFGKLKVLFMYLAFSFHVKGTTDDFVFKVFVLLCYSEIILIILINLA